MPLLVLLLTTLLGASPSLVLGDTAPHYEHRTPSRDGIGKVYMGREISQVRLPPNSIDAALLVDAYHEFAHPREMMQGIVAALRRSGRVFLIEYRGEDPRVPIKPLHKMTEAQARREMGAVGLRHIATLAVLPTQHVLIFEKPALP
jgi:hypothetical protein